MNKVLFILVISILATVSSGYVLADQQSHVLNDFIQSEDLDKKEEAYRIIISHPHEYSDAIYDELHKYTDEEITPQIPDELIYLTTAVRDKKYLEPLTTFIQSRQYSENSCIYDCPIVFSLALYECFSESTPIDGLDVNLTAVSDLRSDIKYVREKYFLKDTPLYINHKRMKEIVKETEQLSVEQLIEQANPSNTYYRESYYYRYAAAHRLSNTIHDDQHLNDLYWLAITEAMDASAQYRSAIYKAIMRAEYARYKDRYFRDKVH